MKMSGDVSTAEALMMAAAIILLRPIFLGAEIFYFWPHLFPPHLFLRRLLRFAAAGRKRAKERNEPRQLFLLSATNNNKRETPK